MSQDTIDRPVDRTDPYKQEPRSACTLYRPNGLVHAFYGCRSKKETENFGRGSSGHPPRVWARLFSFQSTLCLSISTLDALWGYFRSPFLFCLLLLAPLRRTGQRLNRHAYKHKHTASTVWVHFSFRDVFCQMSRPNRPVRLQASLLTIKNLLSSVRHRVFVHFAAIRYLLIYRHSWFISNEPWTYVLHLTRQKKTEFDRLLICPSINVCPLLSTPFPLLFPSLFLCLFKTFQTIASSHQTPVAGEPFVHSFTILYSIIIMCFTSVNLVFQIFIFVERQTNHTL